MGSGFSTVQAWTPESFAEKVSSLGKSYTQYAQLILENSLDGKTILTLNNAEIYLFFEQMGIVNYIHRRVIVSMIKTVLFDETVDFGKPQHDSISEGTLKVPFPPHPLTENLTIAEVSSCVICHEEKSQGLLCNQSSRDSEICHLTCIDCISPYVKSICEDAGRLKNFNFAICCPCKISTLGCTSLYWDSHYITSALLASSSIMDSKAVLDLYISSLSSAAAREAAGPIDDTTPVLAAIADAMCLRCPLTSCKTVLDPRPDGCMAMQCAACGTHFCFLCLSIFEERESCHSHVLDCALNPNPGDYFTTSELFDKVHRDLQIKAIKNVLLRSCDSDENNWRNEDGLVMRSLDGARRLLRSSNISVESILPKSSNFDGFFDGLSCSETLDGLIGHAEDVEVLTRGFFRVGTLTADNNPNLENNIIEIGRGGGIQVIVDALRRYRNNSKLVRNALLALGNIMYNNDRNKAKIISAGGCELVIQILEQYYRVDVNIACNGVVTLSHLSYSEAGLLRIRAISSAVALLTEIIAKYPDSGVGDDADVASAVATQVLQEITDVFL